VLTKQDITSIIKSLTSYNERLERNVVGGCEHVGSHVIHHSILWADIELTENNRLIEKLLKEMQVNVDLYPWKALSEYIEDQGEGNQVDLLGRIRKLCKKKGISVGSLEKELELSNGSIYKWNKSVTRADTLLKVANYFNVSMEYLLEGKEELNERITDIQKQRIWRSKNNINK